MAGVNIAKRKFAEAEGRKISETAVIRELLKLGLEEYGITRADMLLEIKQTL
jgi:hypothetical protein